jgi:hypothetical protein
MLIFLAGAARTGKSMLSRRLLAKRMIPFLSVDVLMMGLVRGKPELKIRHDEGALVTGEYIWPVVYEMSRSLLYDQTDYLFEGELLPYQIAKQRDEAPGQIIGCFLGYDQIDPHEKLRTIRQFSGFPNDWPQEVDDAKLLAIVEREIAFSRYLRQECQRYDLPYFDFSHSFLEQHDQIEASILERLSFHSAESSLK